ncbi:hypothetical protein SAMN06265795_103133 [Noviherbaspirillum humi]|uniref:Uncharacterized protein n=1 Tax=Noviherbaspirillum humi TaxID=1688639 RepID=A0A239F2C2_9BURK|nr:hypothetical protein [Noviherbaspirillum humi]SNS50861.1 hypothetical protein SAMN06265795_103133 [Noviherbaspirillum humi]
MNNEIEIMVKPTPDHRFESRFRTRIADDAGNIVADWSDWSEVIGTADRADEAEALALSRLRGTMEDVRFHVVRKGL